MPAGARLDYAGQILPGWLAIGVGVGLALPTIVSSATLDLAPSQAATDSAVVTMAGQIGSVLGVSLLVIFLAAKHHPDPHHNYATVWGLSAVLLLLSAGTAVGISPARRNASEEEPAPRRPDHTNLLLLSAGAAFGISPARRNASEEEPAPSTP